MELKRANLHTVDGKYPASNRTLWNWNALGWGRALLQERLLIVPYGIETIKHDEFSGFDLVLLIVPYGIETHDYNDDSDDPMGF